MENIDFVLIIATILCILIFCNQKNIESFIIQNISSTTNRLDPSDYMVYLPENELHNPIIPAAKNITNDRNDNTYTTFDNSLMVNPKYRFHPENKHQVSFIIKKKKFGTDIRVSGSNNTFNDISITKDTIIRTNKFNKILEINKKNKTVSVESGVLLNNLQIELLENKLSLPIIPESMTHSIGGAISTGVHGSCIDNGSFSSYIIDITMVLPSGKIQTFTKKDKELKALTTGLGCLGFIYSVTLQCVDPFDIRHEEILSNWNEILPNIKTYLDSNNLLEIYITDPYDKTLPCVLFLRKKISQNQKIIQPNYDRNLKIDNAHNILGNDIQGNYTEQEIGVSIKYINDAINDVVNHVNDAKLNSNLKSKYPIIIRFSKNDNDSYLSTSSKRNLTAWISIFNNSDDAKKDCLDKITKEIEDNLILKYKGRPNYSKRNHLDQEKMSWLYGHCYRDFQYVRNTLDPERLFTNEYIKRVIGD